MGLLCLRPAGSRVIKAITYWVLILGEPVTQVSHLPSLPQFPPLEQCGCYKRPAPLLDGIACIWLDSKLNSWWGRERSRLVLLLQKEIAALAAQMTVMSHLLQAIHSTKTYLTDFWYTSSLEANSVRKETEFWLTVPGRVFYLLNNFATSSKNNPPAPEYPSETWRLRKNVVSLNCFIPRGDYNQTHSLTSKWWEDSCDENSLLHQLRHTDSKTIVFQLSLKNYSSNPRPLKLMGKDGQTSGQC